MEILDNEEILERVEAAIKTFKIDPADSEFQRGYLAALCEMHRIIAGTRVQWVAELDEANKLHKVMQ